MAHEVRSSEMIFSCSLCSWNLFSQKIWIFLRAIPSSPKSSSSSHMEGIVRIRDGDSETFLGILGVLMVISSQKYGLFVPNSSNVLFLRKFAYYVPTHILLYLFYMLFACAKRVCDHGITGWGYLKPNTISELPNELSVSSFARGTDCLSMFFI